MRQTKHNIRRSGSSPHVRGTLASNEAQYQAQRFIPARAGNTRRFDRHGDHRPVHPRTCGEHSSWKTLISNLYFIVKDSTDLNLG
ncbi:conserved hypothetical protein [Gluconacetobacter diazotrophicus PA1 5]|nr:conserved hypothetical protein [Gluconacetobacter diazotrophicus PA1 5]